MKSSNFLGAKPLHWQDRNVDLAAAELLTIHRRGIALGWTKACYLDLADWCEANNSFEMQVHWLRIAYFVGLEQ